MPVQNYLFFEGRCEEALDFYKKALGAQVEALMRYKENPDQPSADCLPPNSAEKVMHCAFRIGDTVVMASDGNCTGKPNFQGFSLALSVKSESDAHTSFAALSDGGTVVMPLGKTFWSPAFGMVNDRFGVSWMVMTIPDCA